jgi:hypothetical protein
MSIAPVTAVKAVRRLMRDACGMKIPRKTR